VFSGSTVRDLRPVRDDDVSATVFDGDVGCADQVAVPVKPAVRARKATPPRFGDTPAAFEVGAGRRSATLIDQLNGDAGLFGLVTQDAQAPADPPVVDAPVVAPPGLELHHPARVTDFEGADPVLDRPVHQRSGGLVFGLADPPFVLGFDLALPGPVLLPPP
jgi:hypothetical protein